MALENARRPYACEQEFLGKQTANECALSRLGITWGDDEVRVCGQRCIMAAIRSGAELSEKEQELARLIAEREIGDDSAEDRTTQVMLRARGVEE